VTIECVPNVSEGRRTAIIEQMSGAIAAVAGVRLLDVSSDASHNRSVFTFVGSPPALETAVLALAAVAIAEIDLRTHQGVHPRIGALDVVPFVPLKEATMADCVALARTVGSALASRYAVPVFLYEYAATRPERRRLEVIRRGGLPALAARMADRDWAPDFGPAGPHPTAGASAVGARKILIAFNVNLATERLEIATRIAAAVRESSGGLPALKAIGVALEDRGCVQVSTNLTDYERTSLASVFGAISREAARAGVTVRESEIIGLIPRAALAGTTPDALRLRGFTEDRVLEHHLG
jgi:glutamate formiminotransferase